MENLVEEETPKYTGLDAAIAGFAPVWQRHPQGGAERVETIIYDGPTLVAHFMEQGMTLEDAHEWIDVNIAGGYLGPATPIIMWPYYPQSTEDSE